MAARGLAKLTGVGGVSTGLLAAITGATLRENPEIFREAIVAAAVGAVSDVAAGRLPLLMQHTRPAVDAAAIRVRIPGDVDTLLTALTETVRAWGLPTSRSQLAGASLPWWVATAGVEGVIRALGQLRPIALNCEPPAPVDKPADRVVPAAAAALWLAGRSHSSSGTTIRQGRQTADLLPSDLAWARIDGTVKPMTADQALAVLLESGLAETGPSGTWKPVAPGNLVLAR